MTVPSVKKLAIKHAVEIALERYGDAPPHRFGMSDDDPANVVLAVSAMRDCKLRHPDKRFFVINTNRDEFVKLEVFPMEHPATAARHGAGVLDDGRTMPMRQTVPDASLTAGGTASVYVSDMDRAIAFYTERLGLALRTRVGSDWAELDAGEGLILGLHPARPPATARAGAVGAVNIELRVREPLERVRARLADRGVEFDSEIQSYPAVRLATVRDPDGNPVILAEVLDPGPPPPPT